MEIGSYATNASPAGSGTFNLRGLLLRRGLFGALQKCTGSEQANGKQPSWEIKFRYCHREHNQNRHHDDGAYTGKTHKVSFRKAA